MKTFTLSIILLFTINLVNAQTYKFPYTDWSESSTYSMSPEPIITGNTVRSDSVALAMNAKEVYEYDSVFYFINSWADYYLWYTTQYHYKFRLPELYQFYYAANDDYSMVRFISQNFTGRYYPSRIVASLGEEHDKRDKYYETWLKKIMRDNKRKEIELQKSHEKEKFDYHNPDDLITDEINPSTKSDYKSFESSERQSNEDSEENNNHRNPASTKQSGVVKEEQESKK